MKFAVDCMLGKLAKWLRILGFDTLFFRAITDEELLRLSVEQGRMLLTRDTDLRARAAGRQVLFIRSGDWRRQIAQVLEELDLRDRVDPYSRCLECNVRLRRLPKSRARNLVTPFVYEHTGRFSLCPECGRVFWQGSHHRDMESLIEQILGKEYNTSDRGTGHHDLEEE